MRLPLATSSSRQKRQSTFASPWALPVLIPIVAACAFTPTFEANDDPALIGLLSGYFGVAADINGKFVSPFFALVFQKLYLTWPTIPWFSLAIYMGLLFSQVLFICTVRASPLSSRAKVVLGLGLTYFVTQLCMRPSFSAASLCLLLASTARSAQYDGVTGKTRNLIVPAFAFGYLLRPSFLGIWALMSVPILGCLLCRKRLPWKPLRRMFLGGACVVLFSLGFDAATMEAHDYAFREANAIRATFSDTSRGDWNKELPGALRAANWSEADYLLARNYWWFYDKDVFSPERIEAFLSVNASKAEFFTWQALLNSQKRFMAEILALGTVLASALFMQGFRRHTTAFWPLLLLLGCAAILAGIRLPPRVALPVFAFTLCAVALLPPPATSRALPLTLPRGAVLLLCASVLGFLSAQKVDSYRKRARYEDAAQSYVQQCFSDISAAYPGEKIFLPTYIYSPYDVIRPFTEYRNTRVPPMMPSGWLCDAPIFQQFLEHNGIEPALPILPQLAADKRFIAVFWQRNLPFEYFIGTFQEYLQGHYTWPETGELLTTKVLRDYRSRRYKMNGLVFFTIEKEKGVSWTRPRGTHWGKQAKGEI